MASSKPTRRRLERIWRPGGLNYWQLASHVVRNALKDDLLGHASQLAFNFLLALFPLLLFLLSIFGLFASRSVQLQDSMLSYFAEILPSSAFQLLKSVVGELATRASGGKLTVGIALALWFASHGMSSMISSLNVVYHARESRSWFRVRVLALRLTLAISVLLLSALFMLLAGDLFVEWMGPKLHVGVFLLVVWKGVQWPAALGLLILSFSLVYYYGPDAEGRRWHWVTAGSICGVVVWLLATAVFRLYIHFFNSYGATYGSLGAVMILLIWVYVTGLSFLLGGEVNAEVERAARRMDEEKNRPSTAVPATRQ